MREEVQVAVMLASLHPASEIGLEVRWELAMLENLAPAKVATLVVTKAATMQTARPGPQEAMTVVASVPEVLPMAEAARPVERVVPMAVALEEVEDHSPLEPHVAGCLHQVH